MLCDVSCKLKLDGMSLKQLVHLLRSGGVFHKGQSVGFSLSLSLSLSRLLYFKTE